MAVWAQSCLPRNHDSPKMYQYQVVVGREGPRLVLAGLFVVEVVALVARRGVFLLVDYVTRPTIVRQCRRRCQEPLVVLLTEDRLVVTRRRRRRRVEDG